jgi:hypothetical protein
MLVRSYCYVLKNPVSVCMCYLFPFYLNYIFKKYLEGYLPVYEVHGQILYILICHQQGQF